MKGIVMRKFWIMLGAAALLLIAAAFLASCGRAEAQGKLQVFYSGNVRGSVAPCGCHVPKGGVARWAAFINRQKNPDASWLTVDAGDYVDRAGNGGCSNKCQFMVTSYQDLHYDVLNVGKQEVWMGYDALDSLIRATKAAKNTQFVSANLINVKTKRPLTNPTVIKDYGHFRVGLIGLLAESDFPRGSSLLDSVHLAVTPYMDAAKKYLPSLLGKTDAVVVLGELSSGQIDTLCKAYPQIALVISTGAVRNGETPAVSGKTHVIGTGSSGYSGHYAMLEFNPAFHDTVGFSQYQDQLTETYDEKGTWADKLAAFNATSNPPSPSSSTPPSVSVKPTSPSTPAPTTSASPKG
jgi:2',3'-cyclic-nucleotide 2'-phosphodiesterase (5'-nucleotidase family)